MTSRSQARSSLPPDQHLINFVHCVAVTRIPPFGDIYLRNCAPAAAGVRTHDPTQYVKEMSLNGGIRMIATDCRFIKIDQFISRIQTISPPQVHWMGFPSCSLNIGVKGFVYPASAPVRPRARGSLTVYPRYYGNYGILHVPISLISSICHVNIFDKTFLGQKQTRGRWPYRPACKKGNEI